MQAAGSTYESSEGISSMILCQLLSSLAREAIPMHACLDPGTIYTMYEPMNHANG